MVQIPNYFAREQAQLVTGSRRATPRDFADTSGLVALSQGLGQVAKTTENISIDIQKANASSYVLENTAPLQRDMTKRLGEMQTEEGDIDTYVDRFEAEFDEALAQRLETAPSDAARTALETNASRIKTSLMGRAGTFQGQEKSRQIKSAALTNVGALANSVFIDPDNYESYKAEAALSIESSKNFLTQSESDALLLEAQSSLAESRIRAEIERNPFGADELLAQDEFVKSLDPNTFQRMQGAIEGKQREILKLRDTDRARYFNERYGITDPTVMLELQEGFPNKTVMSNEQAKAMANQINTIENAQQFTLFQDQFRIRYPQDTYNVALADLSRAGLPKDYQYMLQMNPETDQDVMDLAIDYAQNPSEVKDLAKQRLSVDNLTLSDFDRKFFDEISKTRNLMLIEGHDADKTIGLSKVAQGIAYKHYATNGDMDQAIKVGTEWIGRPYEIVEVNGSPVRVPNEFNASRVQNGADTMLELVKIRVLNGVDSPLLGDLTEEQLRNIARWVPNDDGSGLVLVTDKNEPLFDENREIIEKTYKELEAIDVRRQKTRFDVQEEAAQEALELDRRVQESLFGERDRRVRELNAP